MVWDSGNGLAEDLGPDRCVCGGWFPPDRWWGEAGMDRAWSEQEARPPWEKTGAGDLGQRWVLPGNKRSESRTEKTCLGV